MSSIHPTSGGGAAGGGAGGGDGRKPRLPVRPQFSMPARDPLRPQAAVAKEPLRSQASISGVTGISGGSIRKISSGKFKTDENCTTIAVGKDTYTIGKRSASNQL